MNEFDFQVRPLRPDEICQVCDIFLEEGGFCPPQYLMDMYSYYPHGFYGAVTDTGLVMSTCIALALGDDLAFLSGYVTRKSYRKQGIGTQVFRAAVAPLQHRNIFLDSTASRPQLYKSIGFTIEGPIVINFSAIPDRTYIGKERDNRVKILPHTTVDISAIEAYDTEIHPVNRRTLLHGCLAHSDRAFVAVREGHVVGYTCISTGPQCYFMGMLYADTPTIAHMLWDSCLEHTTPDTTVQVWFFMANEKAADLYSCYKMDLGEVDKSIRLSTKAEMWQPSEKVYSAMQYNTLG